MVRLPEGAGQIRLAPIRALRAVFSGVGQLLMAADRLREEDAEQAGETPEQPQDSLASWNARLSSSVRLLPPDGATDSEGSDSVAKPQKPAKITKSPDKPAEVKRAQAAGADGSRKSARAKAAAEPSRFRSLDLTGNVRMLSEQDIAEMTVDELERSGAIRPNESVNPADGPADAATPSWSQAAPSWSSWSAPQQDESPAEEPAGSDGTGN